MDPRYGFAMAGRWLNCGGGWSNMVVDPAATKESTMNSLSRREALGRLAAAALATALPMPSIAQSDRMQSWPLGTRRRTGIHDLAPAPDE